MNFFEFVKNTINEGCIDNDEDDELNGGLAKEVRDGEIGFEALFPPDNNSAMVAAQAFHHVLTLATKNLLHVQQDALWSNILISVI